MVQLHHHKQCVSAEKYINSDVLKLIKKRVSRLLLDLLFAIAFITIVIKCSRIINTRKTTDVDFALQNINFFSNS